MNHYDLLIHKIVNVEKNLQIFDRIKDSFQASYVQMIWTDVSNWASSEVLIVRELVAMDNRVLNVERLENVED